MRIRVTYEILEGNKVVLPAHYNYHIHGLIYRTFSNELASKLHTEGFIFNKRPFKLFTFSRILEKGNLIKSGENAKLVLGRRISFFFSSPVENIVANLGEMSFKRREFYLYGQRIYLSQLEVITPPRLEDRLFIKALSPITVYSTLTAGDGRKKTYYYSPTERDWEIQIFTNLWRKSQALGMGSSDPAYLAGSRIRPVKVGKQDLRIMKYRDTVIKGWTGIYELDLPEEFFYLAYDAGLGAKNSQGFGMIEVTDSKDERYK